MGNLFVRNRAPDVTDDVTFGYGNSDVWLYRGSTGALTIYAYDQGVWTQLVPTGSGGGGDVQPLDATLTALAGVVSAADKVIYATGLDVFATADLTAAGRALIDDADATAQRATLGLVIGTNVQAQDAELAALAGLTSAADSVPYFTGLGAAALATLSATGRSLIDDASVAAMRATLGSGTTGDALFVAATAAAARAAIGGVLNNYSSSVDPTVTDDTGAGYAAGSAWINLATAVMWRCRDASASAAKWDAVGGGDHPGHIAGLYYNATCMNGSSPVTATAQPANTLIAAPFVVYSKTAVSELVGRVGTQAAGLWKFGIYANALGIPTSLVAEINADLDGNVTAGTNLTGVFGANPTLEPGVYWSASCFSAATACPAAVNNASVGQSGLSQMMGSLTATGFLNPGAGANRVTRTAALSYVAGGASFFPASFGTSTRSSTTAGAPLMAFKAA